MRIVARADVGRWQDGQAGSRAARRLAMSFCFLDQPTPPLFSGRDDGASYAGEHEREETHESARVGASRLHERARSARSSAEEAAARAIACANRVSATPKSKPNTSPNAATKIMTRPATELPSPLRKTSITTTSATAAVSPAAAPAVAQMPGPIFGARSTSHMAVPPIIMYMTLAETRMSTRPSDMFTSPNSVAIEHAPTRPAATVPTWMGPTRPRTPIGGNVGVGLLTPRAYRAANSEQRTALFPHRYRRNAGSSSRRRSP